MKNILMALVFGLSLSAVAKETTKTVTTTSSTSSQASSALSDGQIAKVLITINEGELDAASMAKGQSKNPDVQDFAKMMMAQHKENEAGTKKIAKDDSIKLQDSDLMKSLKEDAMSANQTVKKSDAFDKAYADEQVSMHQKALDTINSSLLPNVKNADLRAHLEKTRDAVVAHLDHAKQLQQKLQ